MHGGGGCCLIPFFNLCKEIIVTMKVKNINMVKTYTSRFPRSPNLSKEIIIFDKFDQYSIISKKKYIQKRLEMTLGNACKRNKTQPGTKDISKN